MTNKNFKKTIDFWCGLWYNYYRKREKREVNKMKKVAVVWNGNKVKVCENRRHAENYVKFINYAKVYAIVEAEEENFENAILKARVEQKALMGKACYNGLNRFGRSYGF